jgi:hypothetical protein
VCFSGRWIEVWKDGGSAGTGKDRTEKIVESSHGSRGG